MSNPQVELHITGYGVITLELDAEKAPKSTENFLAYVNKGHYDNTIFHRVIEGFMIQGGGHYRDLAESPSGPSLRNEAYNGLRNEVGTIAMARMAEIDSATNQFFIKPIGFIDVMLIIINLTLIKTNSFNRVSHTFRDK